MDLGFQIFIMSVTNIRVVFLLGIYELTHFSCLNTFHILVLYICWIKAMVLGMLGFFFFWLRCVACRILVPWPGIEPRPPAVEAPSPNHWTAREVWNWHSLDKDSGLVTPDSYCSMPIWSSSYAIWKNNSVSPLANILLV